MIYDATESFFAIDDYARFATIVSAAASPTGFEAQNLATEKIEDFFRATGLTPGASRVTVDITFAAGTPAREPINYLFIQRPRLARRTETAQGPVFAASDTIRAIFYADVIGGTVVAGGDTGDEASNMVKGLGSAGLWLPAGLDFEAVRLEFDAPSRTVAPNDFVDMGAVRFGPAFQFSCDYIALTERFASRSSAARPDLGAARHARKGEAWRIWDLLFRCVVESEREQARNFILDNYDGSQFVFGFDKTRPHDSWMLAGILNPSLERASRNFRRLPLSLEENF
jgi:hypothetical protein